MVRSHKCMILVLAMVLTSHFPLTSAVLSGTVGVDYGLNGDNLLTPAQTVALLQSKRIRRVRTYEARPDVTRAFANSGIDLTLGVPNEEVPRLAASLSEALNWVTKYVVPFPTSGISALIVGNEWLFNSSNNPALLVPAIKNIHSALSTLKLSYKHLGSIKVSTSHAANVLSDPSFPPSIATFAKKFVPVMSPLLGFLQDTGSFFMVNISPYFAYAEDKSISLEFALFQSTQIVTDPNTKLNYTNLFDLQLDAVYAAIKSLLRTSLLLSSYNGMELKKKSNRNVRVVAGEPAWPSGKGSNGTPPNGRGRRPGHKQSFSSTHSITAPSSTQMMSSFSSNPHAHHPHLTHHASLQNITTLTAIADSPSGKLTSSPASCFTSPFSSSHDMSTHTVPSGLTHAYIKPASTSSSKVRSSATSSSETVTSPLPSSRTTSCAAPSSSSSSMASSSTPSPGGSIHHVQEDHLVATRTPYAEIAQETARGDAVATVDNARTFNQNLIRHVLTAKGTPANPTTRIQAYIFEIFNEDLKPPGIERNFGLFYANGTAVYPINFHDRGK